MVSVDTQTLLANYKALSLEYKKSKLRKILVSMESSREIFMKLRVALDENPRIDDAFCEEVYATILDLGSFISEKDKEKALKNLESIQQRIEAIHQQEEAEKAQENPDALLDQLDDI